MDFFLIESLFQGFRNPPEIRRAIDGEEAVEFIRRALRSRLKNWPELVLLDLNMPRVNGLEVLVFIKSQEFIRDIPVVMLTSSQNDREREKALNLGAEEFLTKPMSIDLMAVLLNGLCARYLPGVLE